MSSSDNPANYHNIDDYEPTGPTGREHLSEIIRIPGYWPVDEDCTERKPTAFCEAGHVQIGSANPCGTRTCPIHWPQWRRELAASMVAQLGAYRYAQGDEWDRGRRMLHVVSAPPQDQRWTVRRFWDERSASYDPVAEAGGRGGAVVAHAYGTSNVGDELYSDAVAAGLDPEYGRWKFLREQAEDWADMRPFVEVRPHFHQFVASEDIDGDRVEEIEAETGWAVNNIRSLARFYIDADEVPRKVRHEADEDEGAEEIAAEGYEDMARLAMYLLSHGAVQPQTGDLGMRQTVTYWGEVNSFDPEEALTAKEWRTIQKHAAAAVGADPPEEAAEDGDGPTCAHDGCAEPIHPLTELEDWMADPDHTWWDGLEYEQQCELLGVAQWSDHKPPPGTTGQLPPNGFHRSPSIPEGIDSDEQLLEWLRRLGRSRVERQELPMLTAPMSAD